MMFFAKMKLRGQLMKAFKLGDIHKQIKTENKTYTRYPKIHQVHIDQEKKAVRFNFTLANGTNPDLVYNQLWVFQQHFGSNIEFIKSKNNKTFIMWVYLNEEKKSYEFNYEEFEKRAKGKILPIIVGKDKHGKYLVFDMIEHPHMLVMGTTGSGKSVYLRSVLSFLAVYMKNNVEFYLADLKRSEFFLFNNLENVKCNVTTKVELDYNLSRIQKELERRGDLFNKAEVNHIDVYNALKTTKKKLPYMMLCIDEFALLKKYKKTMDKIEEISCVGRALGCLLILSMQRGDSKVLEGQLKSNLNVRSVFRTSNKSTSKIGLETDKDDLEDASTIPMNEKGKFYFKLETIKLMQAPLLELEEAKEMLAPYKRIIVHDEAALIEPPESSQSLVLDLPKFTIPEGEKDDEGKR